MVLAGGKCWPVLFVSTGAWCFYWCMELAGGKCWPSSIDFCCCLLYCILNNACFFCTGQLGDWKYPLVSATSLVFFNWRLLSLSWDLSIGSSWCSSIGSIYTWGDFVHWAGFLQPIGSIDLVLPVSMAIVMPFHLWWWWWLFIDTSSHTQMIWCSSIGSSFW